MKKKVKTDYIDNKLDLIKIHPVDSQGREITNYFYNLHSGFFVESNKDVIKFKKEHNEIIKDQNRDIKSPNLKPKYLEYTKFNIGTILLLVKVTDFFFNVPIKRGYIVLDFLNEKFYRLSKSELLSESIKFNVGDIIEKTETEWKLIKNIKFSEFTELEYNRVIDETSKYYFYIKEAKLCKTCKNSCKQAFKIHKCSLYREIQNENKNDQK
mgnify:FL=1